MSDKSPEVIRREKVFALKKKYEAMSAKEKRAYSRAKYYRRTPERMEINKVKAREWAANNRDKSRASSHTYSVRKRYPEAFFSGNLTTVGDLLVWLREMYTSSCVYCGEPATSVDHKVPLAKGGAHHTDNLQGTCLHCNKMKLDHTHDDFLTYIKRIYENTELMSETRV